MLRSTAALLLIALTLAGCATMEPAPPVGPASVPEAPPLGESAPPPGPPRVVRDVLEGQLRMHPSVGTPCPEPLLSPSCSVGMGAEAVAFTLPTEGVARVTLEAEWTPATPGGATLRLFFRGAGGGAGGPATSPFKLEVPLEVLAGAGDAVVSAAPEVPGGLTTTEVVHLKVVVERLVPG